MPPRPKSTAKAAKGKTVATLRHGDKRKNLPTAEYESLMRQEDKSPVQVAYERRNRDLDPQFVWRGKDDQDWSDLVVPAPPLYIQEKVHPKVLIDDLQRQSKARAAATAPQIDLFADFNGLPKDARATEFYQHDANWTNRMILGDSLQVMASLAEREGLRGKVQCIYVDPPYGIKFNSNFQWSTTSRDVKDGNADHITREPEQVKAFRDTWRDGIHSYLTYLRDRLTVARDLLADSGSIFVQIGDENVHRVRGLMDEVFGEDNFVAQISTKTSGGSTGVYLAGVLDHVLWFAKDHEKAKYREFSPARGLARRAQRNTTASVCPILKVAASLCRNATAKPGYRTMLESIARTTSQAKASAATRAKEQPRGFQFASVVKKSDHLSRFDGRPMSRGWIGCSVQTALR